VRYSGIQLDTARYERRIYSWIQWDTAGYGGYAAKWLDIDMRILRDTKRMW